MLQQKMKTMNVFSRILLLALLTFQTISAVVAQNIINDSREDVTTALDGNGTENNPYLISTRGDWDFLTTKINSGDEQYKSAYYKLTNDLTLGAPGDSITTVVGNDKNKPFCGYFDGDFHTIHLTMSRTADFAAVFGVTNSAIISNLNVDGTIVSTHKFAAGIVGYANNISGTKTTKLISCISSVEINCDRIITQDNAKPYDCTYGGLVGQNEAGVLEFENCIFDGRIYETHEPRRANKCTGFAGWINNKVVYRNCTMAGTIDVKENSNALNNSMATFHRLAMKNGKPTAKAEFYDTYYINDYTFTGLDEQGEQAFTELPAATIAKRYMVGENSYLYVPGTIVDGYKVSYYGRSLVEGTDYLISVGKEDEDHSLTIIGIGQYEGSNAETVKSMKVEIETWDEAYGEHGKGWKAISSPMDCQAISGVTNLSVADKHNLFRWSESDNEWQEYRGQSNSFKSFENGRGYIFRTASTEGMIEFNGKYNTGDVKYEITWNEANGDLTGFNLIGNPYPHDIYKGVGVPDDDLVDGYGKLNSDGTWTLCFENEAIPAATAFLVQATKAHTLVMKDTDEAPVVYSKRNNDNICITVNNKEFTDVTRIEFREGDGFHKMAHYNEYAPMLYVSHDGGNYALAKVGAEAKDINLCFKAMEMSNYTLTVKADGNYSYMHLIDKLAGVDVDLLSENSYSFIGMSNDIADRFILRVSKDEAGLENANFAWQNGNGVVVNGEGQLQIFDLTGRMIYDQYVSGIETMNVSSMQTGVYIFKLNEKTQKMVVR